MERSRSLQGQRAASNWFTDSRLHSVIRNGVVPQWFHGIISRKRAEELLMSRPPGHFLIRVSESRAEGYTLSLRGKDCCRHFKIDALEDGRYVMAGVDRRHWFLQDLVDHYRRTPIKPFMEALTVACGQTDNAGMVFRQRRPNRDASLQPNSSLPLRPSHSVSQEHIIPPALPRRPNDPVDPAALSPNSQSNGHNPSLGGDHRMYITALLPVMPVPMPRIKYAANNPPPNRPCSSGPPVKQNRAFVRTIFAPDSSSSPAATEHPLRANIHCCTDANDGALPEEYDPPPPFAPDYATTPFENNG